MLCVLIVLSLNSITYMSLSFGCVLVVNIVVNMCVRACEWVGECLELAHVQGQRHTNDIDASGVFYKLNCSH